MLLAILYIAMIVDPTVVKLATHTYTGSYVASAYE